MGQLLSGASSGWNRWDAPWRMWVNAHWADYVLTIGSLCFACASTANLMNPATVIPLTSSLATGICLAIFSVAQWTKLKVRFGAASNLLVSCLWFLLAIFRHG